MNLLRYMQLAIICWQQPCIWGVMLQCCDVVANVRQNTSVRNCMCSITSALSHSCTQLRLRSHAVHIRMTQILPCLIHTFSWHHSVCKFDPVHEPASESCMCDNVCAWASPTVGTKPCEAANIGTGME